MHQAQRFETDQILAGFKDPVTAPSIGFHPGRKRLADRIQVRLVCAPENGRKLIERIPVEIVPALDGSLSTQDRTVSREDVTYRSFVIEGVICHLLPEAYYVTVVGDVVLFPASLDRNLSSGGPGNERQVDVMFVERKAAWSLVSQNLQQIVAVRSKIVH